MGYPRLTEKNVKYYALIVLHNFALTKIKYPDFD